MGIDLKNFDLLLEQIAEEKGLSKDQILDTIEQAIAAAYKKDYGKKGQIIRAKLNPETGLADFWQIKQVVGESMIYTDEELEKMKEEEVVPTDEEEKKIRFNEERHIMLEDAKKEKPDIEAGDEFEIALERNMDYGRIAAQTAKQVILQKIREAERSVTYDELKSKEDDIVSGVVQRVEGGAAFIEIGKSLGVMPRDEQVPGEFYRPGQRLKFYVLSVEDAPRGPNIQLSRSYPKFVSKLFQLEVPEITSGTVEVKAIAREPGARTKIAVSSNDEQVDPVGAMVGQRGTRVSAVINELGGEKIDIIEWAEDPGAFITNALSPAKALQVDEESQGRVTAIVADDQLSLAIGKDGQNVRLAAKLTGWKIDVRTPEGTQVEMEEAEEGDVGDADGSSDDVEEEQTEEEKK